MPNPYSKYKIFYHNDILDSLKNNQVCAPLYIRLKPTNLCNHHCSYCTYGSGNTAQKTSNRDEINHMSMIPWDKMQEIIVDMGVMGVKAVTLSGGGEPLTYPHILDVVRNLKSNDIELSLISNGQLLDGEVAEELYAAKWVRISFDSPREKEYCSLRNLPAAAFDKVCQNIESFAKRKDPNCVLGINFVVNHINCGLVYEAGVFLKELGVDNVKFSANISNIPGYHYAIKDNVIEQIHRAQNELESDVFQVFNNYENDWMDKNFSPQDFSVCYTCRFVTVIAADQKVYLCHTRAYDSKAVIGDLRNKAFRELWFSGETQDTLKGINPRIDCQNFCVYRERNKLIDEYLDVDENHINFI